MDSANNSRLKHVPNGLSWFRICAVPVTIYLAWQGFKNEFILLFSLAMISDFLDGYIARKYGQATSYGAVLDSVADLLTYFALPVNLWLLWPMQVEREWLYIFAGVGCYLLPIFVSYMKFRRFPSFHTWSAKLGAVASIPVLVLWIAFDWPLALHMFVWFQFWVATEQLLLIWILKEWSCNIPSVFTVRHRVRQSR